MSVSFLVIWGFYNINKYHGKRFQRTLLSLMDDHSSGGASFDLADIAFTVSGVRYESFARNCVDRRRAVILSCTMSCSDCSLFNTYVSGTWISVIRFYRARRRRKFSVFTLIRSYFPYRNQYLYCLGRGDGSRSPGSRVPRQRYQKSNTPPPNLKNQHFFRIFLSGFFSLSPDLIPPRGGGLCKSQIKNRRPKLQSP